jgi:hypothetical protein
MFEPCCRHHLKGIYNKGLIMILKKILKIKSIKLKNNYWYNMD